MNKYLQTFNTFKMLMSDSKELTNIDQLAILIHSVNKQNNLVCLDGTQQCQFPVNWKSSEQNTYTFTYRNNRNNAILKVKATKKQNKFEVIFNEANSSVSYRAVLNFSQSNEQNVKTYDFNLQQYLKESQKLDRPAVLRNNQTRKISAPIQSYGSSPPQTLLQNNLGCYPPSHLINSPSNVKNPFGQEEYVGQNSKIFNPHVNPYENVQPYPGSLRIPPGARYDPIDPFDNPMKDNTQGPQDFFGFDEFGRPKKSPFGGMNNNVGGRGGFGGNFGGFGGGFGGMGGGFGPNFGV